MQANTFLVIFEIDICWASVTNPLIVREKKKNKRRVRMGERRVLKIYVPSKSFLRIPVSKVDVMGKEQRAMAASCHTCQILK